MSLIEYYQQTLDKKTFWRESLSESIRFEAKIGEPEGIIFDERGKSYYYSLAANGSILTISHLYFENQFRLRGSSFGFHLVNKIDNTPHLTYIEDFWVNNQKPLLNTLSPTETLTDSSPYENWRHKSLINIART